LNVKTPRKNIFKTLRPSQNRFSFKAKKLTEKSIQDKIEGMRNVRSRRKETKAKEKKFERNKN
jgi:hypothetical protein